MSQRKYPDTRLTRRNLMVLATSALAGCGGGSIDLAGSPGTGGTGIYLQGTISGFGSVIVNGIKFDDGQAAVQVDGVSAASAELRLGMVASLQGEIGAVAAMDTASSIDVWSIAQGLITQVGAGEFTVAGLTVLTDRTTVLEGVASAALLSVGQRVVVWGLQAGADARTWKATRVTVLVMPATATLVSTGLINVEDSQLYLNGLRLTGILATSLTAGQLVRVQGVRSSTGDSIAVVRVDVRGLNLAALPSGEIEIEGVVTTPLVNGRFMLGNIVVDASSAFYKPASYVLAAGARVEVYGSWQPDGVLKATEVEYEDDETLSTVKIEANIEQFTSLADFVVRGQRCNATGAKISHGVLADLRVGVKVKVKGTKAGGDVLMVTELEFDH
jgi:hypothetical protein